LVSDQLHQHDVVTPCFCKISHTGSC